MKRDRQWRLERERTAPGRGVGGRAHYAVGAAEGGNRAGTSGQRAQARQGPYPQDPPLAYYAVTLIRAMVRQPPRAYGRGTRLTLASTDVTAIRRSETRRLGKEGVSRVKVRG